MNDGNYKSGLILYDMNKYQKKKQSPVVGDKQRDWLKY